LLDPLNTILLALELHSGDGDPWARRDRVMAAHQARRAVRIIDDLFHLCAGSRGRLPLREELVEPADGPVQQGADGRLGRGTPASASR
jgi:hypothetical protein